MRIWWDMAELLWGRKLEDVACVAAGPSGTCVRDARGGVLLSAEAGSDGFSYRVKRVVNPSKLVVVWGETATLRTLRASGADVYVPALLDLKREAYVAGLRCPTFAALCRAVAVDPTGDRAWRMAACVRALLNDSAYVDARARENDRTLRQVQLRLPDHVPAPRDVPTRRAQAHLELHRGMYACYSGGMRVGAAACADQVRDLYGLGSADALPPHISCDVEITDSETDEKCVAVLADRGSYLKTVDAFTRIHFAASADDTPSVPAEQAFSGFKLVT
jgi:hypothetical protein